MQVFIKVLTSLKLMPKTSKLKIVEFANSIGLDEAAHTEQPHLDLHYLPSVYEFSI